MKPKSLLLVGSHLSLSGQNKSVGEELATRLALSGWRVMLTSRKVNRLARLADMLFTIIIQRSAYSIACVDVFSGPAFLWAYLSALLLRILRKPFILTLHGGNLPYYAVVHSTRVKRLLSWTRIVSAPSPYLIQKMAQYRADIRLIRNGIEVSKYPYHIREMPEAKIVWLRAFHQIYNPSLAPRVMSILRQYGIDCTLKMIGPDKGDGSLQEMLKISDELGVRKSINVNGSIAKERVPDELCKGDIFLNTTNFDNTPVSVIEAMACGLCVITTNVGGIPFLIEEGRDGMMVPPNDAEAMAAAIHKVLTEPGLSAQLSRNARRKAELFDWSLIVPQWEKSLQEITGSS